MNARGDIPAKRTVIWGGLLAALLFLSVWLPLHPARPHLPTSDLYEHLSTARHLCDGDGFVTDMAYPLSFAYPFARELPQPLIHRGPGYPLLLTVPYLASDGSPAAAVEDVRWLQIALLGLLVAVGAGAWLARGRPVNAAPWLVLLMMNPLLAFAVDWGFIELSCGLLLLVLWLRVRDADPAATARTGVIDGLLGGGLVLLRLDLFWVPLLWWLGMRRFGRRRLLLAVLVAALLLLPWEVRNVHLTGRPFFSLQAQAELVKGTPAWPDYSVYRQLEPQPPQKVLREMPGAVAHKAASGMKFHVRNAKRLLPGWYWLGLAAAAIAAVVRRRAGRTAWTRPAPLTGATLTMVLLAAQYSFFDANLRHLLVLLPILLWELSPWTGEIAADALARRWPRMAGRFRVPVSLGIALALTVSGALLFPTEIPGWRQAESEARAAAERLPDLVSRARQSTDTVYFTEYSAVSWMAGRTAVWDPRDETVRSRIQDMISPHFAAPAGPAADPVPEDLTP